ncbi:MAG TPA: exosortase A, partial [Anaerolineales bacterium]
QTEPTVLVATKTAAGGKTWIWQVALLVVTIGVLYFNILGRLVNQWANDDNYSHGFFVPVFAAFVIWSRREKLREIPLQPSWLGLPVVLGSLLMLTVGILGAELFLSRSSLVFLLAGIILYQIGWGFFRALFFPWACLFLMIPIPAIIFNQIAFPLQLLASQSASNMLELLGVPSLREGNVIRLPYMTLEVVEACSGIRSLVSLGTLAIIYGYFLESRVWRRVVLAVAAVPIAVAANALRVMGTGLLGHYWDPDKALGFFHTFSGWVIFVLSVVLLFGVHGLMNLLDRFWRKRAAARAEAQ